MKAHALGRTTALSAVVLLVLFTGSSCAGRSAQAANDTPGHKYNLLGESVGLVGYDPVSYFPEGGARPQKGLIDLSVQHDGVNYRFATQENLDRFKKSPEKYLPAYGGWCAWAVAQINKRVDVDPESFEIRDGRLYVFYRDAKLDTRSIWLPKADDMIARGNSNYPALTR